jgi:hypothetical protein
MLPADIQRDIMASQRANWDAVAEGVTDPRTRLALAARMADALDCRVAEQTAILAECIEAMERASRTQEAP